TPSPDGTALEVAQERFLYLGGDDDTRWSVPVMVRAGLAGGGEVRHKTLLTGATATIELGGKADWVVVNDGASGFYRVRYDAAPPSTASDSNQWPARTSAWARCGPRCSALSAGWGPTATPGPWPGRCTTPTSATARPSRPTWWTRSSTSWPPPAASGSSRPTS